MKKVSVQFNLVVDDAETHKDIAKNIRCILLYERCWWKITAIQINNTEKRGKR